jgi:mRNA interferase RelE/StbE
VADWQVLIDGRAKKDLRGLGSPDRVRVLRYLKERIALLDNPRQLGAPLAGEFAGLWRYRVGHMRIVARIEEEKLVVLVISVGPRGSIYR